MTTELIGGEVLVQGVNRGVRIQLPVTVVLRPGQPACMNKIEDGNGETVPNVSWIEFRIQADMAWAFLRIGILDVKDEGGTPPPLRYLVIECPLGGLRVEP